MSDLMYTGAGVRVHCRGSVCHGGHELAKECSAACVVVDIDIP